ncbi:MAG: AAA family ATPase [Clostridiales bacterium]|nr:AAA family ATPase [Clostridiales bacterium]
MTQKPYVIAIAGGTCSGKSTLTDIIAESIKKTSKAVVFNMDNYFKDTPPNVIAPITRKEYAEHNHPTTLDLEQLEQDFVAALSEDWDLIIVEGIFALHLDIFRQAADIKVYVDLESDARLTRSIKRRMSWGETFDEVTERYLDTIRFRHNELVEPSRWHADVVINGEIHNNKCVDMLLLYIETMLK